MEATLVSTPLILVEFQVFNIYKYNYIQKPGSSPTVQAVYTVLRFWHRAIHTALCQMDSPTYCVEALVQSHTYCDEGLVDSPTYCVEALVQSRTYCFEGPMQNHTEPYTGPEP